MADVFLFRVDDNFQAVTCTEEQIERIRYVVQRFDLPITIFPNLDVMEFEDFVKFWRTFEMPETGRDDITVGDLFEGRFAAE